MRSFPSFFSATLNPFLRGGRLLAFLIPPLKEADIGHRASHASWRLQSEPGRRVQHETRRAHARTKRPLPPCTSGPVGDLNFFPQPAHRSACQALRMRNPKKNDIACCWRDVFFFGV